MTRRRTPTTDADDLDQYFTFDEPPEFKPAEVRDATTDVLLPGCAAFDNLPWPADVPILVAADLIEPPEPDCVGGRKALWVWFRETFPPGTGQAGEMREAAWLQLGLLVTAGLPPLLWPSLNTWARGHSKEEAAALWNAFLRQLGYATPEPEPKKKRRKK